MTSRKRSAAELEEPDVQDPSRTTRLKATPESGMAPESKAEIGGSAEDRLEVEVDVVEEDGSEYNESAGENDEVNDQESEGEESDSGEPETQITWTCDCRQPALLLVAGQNAQLWNRGRPFAKCATGRCGFWTWTDNATPESQQQLFNESMDARLDSRNYGDEDGGEDNEPEYDGESITASVKTNTTMALAIPTNTTTRSRRRSRWSISCAMLRLRLWNGRVTRVQLRVRWMRRSRR
ncbi:hypothetical protein C8F04DRAFT_1098853 [Mycena alexandri]|uniref:GRF-type domain-containing protein n=1 Tax=Mycena alexandri TaxID=1745969 RepID=A0AAD6X4K1_9AGAR|nr:hypothetical protein C8F04DRAFT_1098853 [Mycena alexandri]